MFADRIVKPVGVPLPPEAFRLPVFAGAVFESHSRSSCGTESIELRHMRSILIILTARSHTRYGCYYTYETVDISWSHPTPGTTINGVSRSIAPLGSVVPFARPVQSGFVITNSSGSAHEYLEHRIAEGSVI